MGTTFSAYLDLVTDDAIGGFVVRVARPHRASPDPSPMPRGEVTWRQRWPSSALLSSAFGHVAHRPFTTSSATVSAPGVNRTVRIPVGSATVTGEVTSTCRYSVRLGANRRPGTLVTGMLGTDRVSGVINDYSGPNGV